VTNVVLINPPSRSGYGDLADDLSAIEPPAWCRMIAGYLRDRGFRVFIIDADGERLSADDIGNAIARMASPPRIACVVVHGHQPSASTQLMGAAEEVCRAIKIRMADVSTMVVGGHPSALPVRTLLECSDFDYACVGEGPITIERLLQGDKLAFVPGLVWRNYASGEVVVNSRAPLLPIDDLRGNAWYMLPPLSQYRAHNWQCLDGWPRSPYASIYTTLGCPYSCHFCMINAPFDSHAYRMRQPQHVAAEIVRLYRQFGVRTFKIVDEMFILNPRHYGEICNGIIEAGIGDDINIWAYARVDTVRSDRLAQLRNAGFRWLALGIESASAYVRDGARKRLKNDDIIGVVRAIQAVGINVIGNFIFGLPDDDFSSMRATLALAQELNCEFANFYSAMAYPGSPLYAEAVREGWDLPSTWDGYSQHGYETRPLATRALAARDVLAFRDQAFDAYFGSARYTDMIGRKFGDTALMQLKKMREHAIPRGLFGGCTARDLPDLTTSAPDVLGGTDHQATQENAPVGAFPATTGH